MICTQLRKCRRVPIIIKLKKNPFFIKGSITRPIGSADLKILSQFFQAEDGIRDRSPSRGLGDVYKRQVFRDFNF